MVSVRVLVIGVRLRSMYNRSHHVCPALLSAPISMSLFAPSFMPISIRY